MSQSHTDGTKPLVSCGFAFALGNTLLMETFGNGLFIPSFVWQLICLYAGSLRYSIASSCCSATFSLHLGASLGYRLPLNRFMASGIYDVTASPFCFAFLFSPMLLSIASPPCFFYHFAGSLPSFLALAIHHLPIYPMIPSSGYSMSFECSGFHTLDYSFGAFIKQGTDIAWGHLFSTGEEYIMLSKE